MSDEVSNFRVPLTEIVEIKKHPNADRLDIAIIYGFQVVVKKDVFKKGDKIIYIPIDSVLIPELEYQIFSKDSKIKLSKHRVKQIRIRKLASQGMVVRLEDIKVVFGFTPNELEKDYKDEIKVIKYEPPTPKFQSSMGGGVRKVKPLENPNFQKYNGLTNIKWCPFLFKEGEEVVYQEKVHGSNSRASILPFAANTLLKKIKKFFRLTPKFEFCYGSNNVQLQQRKGYTGYYGEDVYGRVFKELNVEPKLKPNEIIYGEIYGEGIQGNYSYGLKGEQKFVLFDVKILEWDGTQTWLSPDKVKAFAKERGFEMVPEIYRGPFISLEHAKEATLRASELAPSQKVMEGLVVKAVDNYSDERGNKRALKCISEKYLDRSDNTDYH